jgi:hypothetical protein
MAAVHKVQKTCSGVGAGNLAMEGQSTGFVEKLEDLQPAVAVDREPEAEGYQTLLDFDSGQGS